MMLARMIVLLLLLPAATLAQNAKIDSLKRVIETTKVDTVKGRTLCRLCTALRPVGKMTEGLAFAKQGLEICQQAKDMKGEGFCLNSVGGIYYNQGDFRSALSYFQRSLEIREKTGDRAGTANNLNNLGSIYGTQGDIVRALDYYQRSLKIKEEIGDQDGVAKGLRNLGMIYNDQGDYVRALGYFQRSFELSQQIGDRPTIASNLGSIGEIYFRNRDIVRSLDLYERCLAINEELGDRAAIASNLNNIGVIYEVKNDYNQALKHYWRSLKILEEIGDQKIKSFCLTSIGNVYRLSGQSDSARIYTEKGLTLALEMGHLAYKKFGYQVLYAIDSSISNWKDAFLAHQHYKALSDSMKNNEKSKAMGRLEARFESEKEIALRDLEITKLEADRLRKDLNIKEQRSRYLQDSLTNAEQKAHLEANSLRLAQQIKERDQQRERDSLENASHFERLERERVEQEADLAQQRWLLGSAGGSLLLLLAIAFTLFRGRRKEKRANAELRALNDRINLQKAEIEAQNSEITSINSELQSTLVEVSSQRQVLEQQHAKIEDSIRYASRIQGAILPAAVQLQEYLPPHFIHYQPRDIVSGDFYWMTRHQERTFFAAVDCTGHGVPGAFMSVLGSNLLHQIVDENQITQPDLILAELDRRIAVTLRQQFGGESKDGMDLALVVLHEPNVDGKRTIEYAGAGRPLWVWSKGEITEYTSAKYSCGGSQHKDKQYPAHSLEVGAGDRLYLFSDGPVDQFGGPSGRKLGSKQLQAFLSNTAALPIEAQGQAFADFFSEWMRAKKQLDDVLLAGIAL